jgi:hypothetical protein
VHPAALCFARITQHRSPSCLNRARAATGSGRVITWRQRNAATPVVVTDAVGPWQDR